MKAKHTTPCLLCLKDIQPGQEIENFEPSGWVHTACAIEAEGPLPTFGKTAPPKGGSWR